LIVARRVGFNLTLACVGVAAITTAAAPACAQSAQPWSVQASALGASQKIGGDAIAGFGFEGQLRYTPLALWSLGGGVQYSTHSSAAESITIVGVFLEPRYTFNIGSDRVAPYIAGRLAFLRESASLHEVPGQASSRLIDFASTGSAFGAGGGLLVNVSPRVNLDFGAAFVSQAFGDATADDGAVASFPRFTGYVAKGGISIGFGSR
jgi:hypothetical protein